MDNKKKIIILGTGGHPFDILDTINDINLLLEGVNMSGRFFG